MNKQELIEKVKEIGIYGLNIFGTVVEGIPTKTAIELIKQLDEPETGHADEAPRYVKNILARLRELALHDREVWLKAIMGEFEKDFSRAKWREGYEQGKLDGAWVGNQLKDADKIRQELNKPVIPQFVAEHIEWTKEEDFHLLGAMNRENFDKKLEDWFYTDDNMELFARAWLDGYEVEKEKRYLVKMKNILDRESFLNLSNTTKIWFFGDKKDTEYVYVHHTRKELEEANFGWVFSCEGIEIEEVE